MTAALPLLETLTIADALAGLEAASFTSVDLVRAYSARIGEVNETLRPVLEINFRALDQARDSDAARAAGRPLGALEGLPILIKGNMAVARPDPRDLQCHAGSFALKDSVPSGDCAVVTKLREAGAIILGTAALSQWANYRSDNSSSGWSAIHGQTYGAYYAELDPSGSSSGSGVAADLALAVATIGTETDGSIISPAQFNAVVGLKPSVGLTSRFNVIPLSSSQDSVGPMTRSVADAAAILSVIAGPDERDAATAAIPSTVPDYRLACKLDALRGARIGVPRNYLAVKLNEPDLEKVLNKDEYAAYEAALEAMRKCGAEVVDADFPDLQAFVKLGDYAHSPILPADLKVDLPAYLDRLIENPNNIRSVADVVRFTRTDERECYPDRDTARLDHCDDAFARDSDAYRDALKTQRHAGSDATVLGALEAYRCDALVLPTSIASTLAALAGYPALSVPAGAHPAGAAVTRNKRGNLVATAPGVPIGITWLGRRFSEATLIGLAYAFEQASASSGPRISDMPAHARDALKHAEGIALPRTQLADVIRADSHAPGR